MMPGTPLSKPKGKQNWQSSLVIFHGKVEGLVSAASREPGKIELLDFLSQFEALI